MPVVFIMLNPITANAELDDATIRRCMSYTHSWGGSKLIVVNLFAYRATDPKMLTSKEVVDPVGCLNDEAIRIAANYANRHNGKIVAVWDETGKLLGRSSKVLTNLHSNNVTCLKQNKSGEPAHPLYQKRDLVPKEVSFYEV
jgi:hypothetical protein